MAHPYYGTPSGGPAHCTPSAMYMAHPYYVPGTPILWHNLHIHGARKGVLAAGRVSVKTRRCGLHVPRDGSGEPARAWGPAWDTIAASPCRAPGVTFVLPRWHTQRSGRCPNSR